MDLSYGLSLELQQQVGPEQVAVSEEVRRVSRDDADAFNLFSTREAHVTRELVVAGRFFVPRVNVDQGRFDRRANERMSCAAQVWSNALAAALDQNLPFFV